MSPDEFGAKIKAKYPQYADMDNAELSQRIVSKHPEYKSQVDFEMRDAVASQPRQAADAGEALITNLPTTGFKQDFVRGLPAGLMSMAGAAAGAAALGPMGAIAGATLGGAAGEAGRQSVAQGTAAAFPEAGYPIQKPGQVLKDIGTQGVVQGAVEGLGVIAAPILKATGRGLVNNPLARAVGGYTEEAATRLLSRAEAVVSKLGSKDEIGGRTFEAAKNFKNAIAENLDLAGEKYRQLINKVVGDTGELGAQTGASRLGPGARFNVQAGVADDAAKILKESGYGQPGRMTDSADSEKFLGFFRRVNELKEATPDQVYWLQRDLNNALQENNSKALNGHLRRLKGSIDGYLDKTLPEIREANAIYRRASELSEGLSKIDSADEASKAILSRYRAPGSDTRQAILAATKEIPAAQAALDELLDLGAAGQFSPKMTSIPRTGFVPGLGVAGATINAPLAAAAGVAGMAGMSPRLTAYVVRATQNAAEQVAGRMITAPLAGGASPIAQEYMRARFAR